MKSRDTVDKHLMRAADATVQASDPKAAAGARSSLDPVVLVRRSLASNAGRNVILATVLGIIGFVALAASAFLLFRYWTRRRTASSADMFIQRPIHAFSDPQEKPVYHAPPPPPRPLYTPDRAYFPNHPYALAYSRPPWPSAISSITPDATVAGTPPRSATPLVRPISHPYARSSFQPRHEFSTDAANTIHMVPDSLAPSPEPDAEPSPFASTAGGAIINPSFYETAVSDDTVISSLSRSSSAPLQGHQRPYRQ